ncbi:MAG: citrate synthase [Ignavibacteriae bacterium]|nr:MAG: citrate synthase [Ignavibacteriota bacterium]
MANTLTITDNRTGKSYELPIEHDTVRAMDLRKIKVTDDEFGMMTYDPAFMNTASCISKITYIDGDKGILRYRGYPIDQLAEKSSHLEVAYLLMHGELPTAPQLKEWSDAIMSHSDVFDQLQKGLSGFRQDAHPMGMLASLVAALSTYYPESRKISDPANRQLQIHRLIAKMPTLGAWCFRQRKGLAPVAPEKGLSYTGNFLQMLYKAEGQKYSPNPVLERALDILFILHADHEQNCSTSAMRAIGSSQADPYVSMSGALSALYGPLHGGANEQVLVMLKEIGSKDHIPAFIKEVKEGKGEKRLMGFGHRVYKNYDPRAKIIKQTADQVFEVTGRNPLLDIALELERIALQDEYFVKRKLYPNVDFYSGIIYQAMGFPPEFFTVLFAIPRAAGWLVQWLEMVTDPEQKIARPRQIYLGSPDRNYVPLNQRA